MLLSLVFVVRLSWPPCWYSFDMTVLCSQGRHNNITAINGRKSCHQLIGVCILCFMLSSSLRPLHTAFCKPHLSCTMLISFNLCSTMCQIVQKSFGCFPYHMMYGLCQVVCRKRPHTVASLCHMVCHVVSRLCPAVIKKLLHTVVILCCVMRQAIKHLHTVTSLCRVMRQDIKHIHTMGSLCCVIRQAINCPTQWPACAV